MKPKHFDDLEREVVHLALYSRLAILLLQFICNVLIPDHQNDAFLSPFNDIPKATLDIAVDWLLGGLVRWDAQHHLHISIYGYAYEQSLAFFPGFALCIRAISYFAKIALFPLNLVSVHLISSVLLNLVCFTLAAKTLFRLTYKKLQDENVAYLTCFLFCINPASVFFSAPYSEALFSYISFSAMLNEGMWQKYFLISISSIIRSNGVVNVGFPLYEMLKKFFASPKNFLNIISLIFNSIVMFVSTLFLFFLYQMFSYIRFCVNHEEQYDSEILKTAIFKSYVLAGHGVSGMCEKSHVIPYFYIQKTYWNVGFMEYFQYKQFPNFLLAFPIVYFVIVESFKYYKRNIDSTLTLGFTRYHQASKASSIFEYVVHLSFLLVICLFFVHIQVTTRLLCSSSPALYWLAAMLIYSKENKTVFSLNDVSQLTTTTFAIFTYCLSYFIFGTALFCNHYPWT